MNVQEKLKAFFESISLDTARECFYEIKEYKETGNLCDGNLRTLAREWSDIVNQPLWMGIEVMEKEVLFIIATDWI